jgi:hypothetical protein
VGRSGEVGFSLNSSAAANFDMGLHYYQLIMDYKIILILIFENIAPLLIPLLLIYIYLPMIFILDENSSY